MLAAGLLWMGHPQFAALQQRRDIFLHHVMRHLNTKIFCNFVSCAGQSTKGQQVFFLRKIVTFRSRCRFRCAVLQCYDKFIPPVFKHRRRQTVGRHFPPDGWNAGIAIFSRCQCFGHNRQRRISQIRAGRSQLIDRQTAIQTAGTVDFQTVIKKENLNGRSFGVLTVVSVDQRIQNGFADRGQRIFRNVLPFAGLCVDNCPALHVADAKRHSFLQHIIERSLHSFVIQETRLPLHIAHCHAGNNHCRNRKLREQSLRIETEIQYSCQGWNTICRDTKQLVDLLFRQFGKAGPGLLFLKHVSGHRIWVQQLHVGAVNGAFIVMQMTAKCLKTVQFQIRHHKIAVAHPDIRTFDPTAPLIVAGPFCNIQSGDFSSANHFSVYFRRSKNHPNRRLHLIGTLFRNAFLQSLYIPYSNDSKVIFFRQPEKNGSAA